MHRALSGIVLGLAALAFSTGCGNTVSEEELARRVAESRPTWESYSEDIKAQLGAGPAAEWEGTLQEVRVQLDQIHVTFTLAGPWSQRAIAAPILLNEPVGGARQNSSAKRDGNRVTYTFPNSSLGVPWIELKSPSGQRRVALSEKGTWTAS